MQGLETPLSGSGETLAPIAHSRYSLQDVVDSTSTSDAIKPVFKSDYRKTKDPGWVSWLKAHDEPHRQERETTQQSSPISVDKEPYQ